VTVPPRCSGHEPAWGLRDQRPASELGHQHAQQVARLEQELAHSGLAGQQRHPGPAGHGSVEHEAGPGGSPGPAQLEREPNQPCVRFATLIAVICDCSATVSCAAHASLTVALSDSVSGWVRKTVPSSNGMPASLFNMTSLASK
jgi:hypothetical protein